MIHELKIFPQYFTGVVAGVKRAELRRTDDRRFNVGDILKLREYDSGAYTGNSVNVVVLDVADVTPITGLPMALLSFELTA